MKFSIPYLVEINSELKRYEYYIDGEFESKSLNAEITANVTVQNEDSLVFFIHVRFKYDSAKEEKTLFHADYITTFKNEDGSLGKDLTIEIEKEQLAHLLGMSILMVRGAMAMSLKGNVIARYPLPVISPLEILTEKLDTKESKFIVPIVENS